MTSELFVSSMERPTITCRSALGGPASSGSGREESISARPDIRALTTRMAISGCRDGTPGWASRPAVWYQHGPPAWNSGLTWDMTRLRQPPRFTPWESFWPWRFVWLRPRR